MCIKPSNHRLYVVIGLMGSLVGGRVAVASSGESVKLAAGGITSSGLEISIDLDTGLAIERTTPLGSIPPGKAPVWRETRRNLTPKELDSLKKVIKRDLSEDIRSKYCKVRDEEAFMQGRIPMPPPPIADAINVIDLNFERRNIHADIDACTGPALHDIWEAVYRAASPEEANSPY